MDFIRYVLAVVSISHTKRNIIEDTVDIYRQKVLPYTLGKDEFS